MKKTLAIIFVFYTSLNFSQGNCLLYPEGSNERKACELAGTIGELKQGSRESQLRFDSIIKLNPNYAWAYFEKSVAFLKRGLLVDGFKLLNKAVELAPKSHLCYRAYWYFQNRNYKMCINDLESYYALPNAYIYELTPGGEKDMRIILGLAYAKTGNLEKAIETIVNCFKSYKSEDDFGLSDYHTLGILYVKNKQYDKAIKVLNKQISINKDLAATYYYLGLAYKGLANKAESVRQFKDALLKFEDPYRYFNANAGFKVYLSDIQKEIQN